MEMMDSRKAQLHAWLPSQLAQTYATLGWGEVGSGELSAASADASFRRYFRWVDGSRSIIVMDAPPEQEDSAPFVRIAALLAEAGVRTPQIYSADLQKGFLLLEDMGASTYLQSIQQGIDDASIEQLYATAITTLVRWQQASRPGVLADYDETILRRELQLFPDWYVSRHLQRQFSSAEEEDWQTLSRLVLDSNLAEPQVFVHRDYMPRNLMTADGEPGVLDFQDALYGPLSYDVTSLLADAFFTLPLSQREVWLERYWQQAREAGLPTPADFQTFRAQSRLMGVQRHLKVLGIFARINYRDGKAHYLSDTPRFVGYLREACAQDHRLAPLERLLDSLGLHA
ncbi:aminoglycoside phosphotransferase family protein [Halopseudomonas sp.]|jgi:aminoglycoside/choline kinase family phosphotransferase|uniref:aminoglycoside phosphotransferase family protein n=1 Tax=Halopseudomonas sp. TaxID=2901191 RepID=UPI0039E5B99F